MKFRICQLESGAGTELALKIGAAYFKFASSIEYDLTSATATGSECLNGYFTIS